jgi:hypothetical protein
MLRVVFALISSQAIFWFVIAVPVVLGLIAFGAMLSGSRKGGGS